MNSPRRTLQKVFIETSFSKVPKDSSRWKLENVRTGTPGRDSPDGSSGEGTGDVGRSTPPVRLGTGSTRPTDRSPRGTDPPSPQSQPRDTPVLRLPNTKPLRYRHPHATTGAGGRSGVPEGGSGVREGPSPTGHTSPDSTCTPSTRVGDVPPLSPVGGAKVEPRGEDLPFYLVTGEPPSLPRHLFQRKPTRTFAAGV